MTVLAGNEAAGNECARILSTHSFDNNLNIPPSITLVIKSIQQKMKTNRECIIKVDKENTQVIMTCSNYDVKINEFLTSSNRNHVILISI